MFKKITGVFLCFIAFSNLNAQVDIIDEDFSSGSLPAGWSNIDNGSSPAGDKWEFNDPGGRNITAGNFSGNFAILDSDNYGSGNSQDASLETNSFNTSTYELVTLEYDYQYRDYQSPESCEVEVYNGSTWVSVASYTTNSGDNYDSATKVTLDITTAAGGASNAKIRFTYTGDWDWWWALDNIKVTGTLADTTSLYRGPGGIGTTDGSSSLELWLRGDNGVTSNGSDVVTAWLDNSGNGNDVSLIGGNPTYTSDINNHEVISLDGNDYFQSGVASNTSTTASVYFTGTITGYSDTWAGILSGSKSGQLDWNTTDHVVFLDRNSGSDDLESYRNGQKSAITDGLLGSGVKIMNSEYDGTNNTIRLDGTAGTSIASSGSFDFNLIGIGKRITENKYTIGDYGEVIYYSEDLSLVEKIIIENYLQAKYNGTLSSNNFYNEDTNGDFDYDVAGIGQATDGSRHDDSQGTGIVRIYDPSAMGNDEYLFWGRNNKTALSFETNTDNYKERLNTLWRVSRRNNPGTVSIIFDLSGVDLSGKQDCADLQLVIDNNSDLLSPSNTYTLTDLGSGFYQATGVTFANNRYFSLEYQDKIVVDDTQFYNGSGASNVPDTSDGCFKLLVKNTADGTISLTENADVREVEVESGGKLVSNTGIRLRVTNGILNNGDIRMVGTSQLIQTHTGTSLNTGSGDLYIDQQGTNNSIYRYNYWSSPVASGTATYTVDGVMKDGSTVTSASSSPDDINFVTGFNGDTTSPITISNYWIYKYDVNWASVLDSGTLEVGQGYTMKGPGAVQGYTFVGTPNDGDYTISVVDEDAALVGNPYPSALDADAFITLNSLTNGIIDGSIYFWEHNGEVDGTGNNGHYKSGYQGGYAVRNIGGGVAAIAPTGIDGLGTSSGDEPGQYIAIGQGFFVNATGTGNVEFENSMRAFQEEDDSSSIFFKSKRKSKSSAIKSNSKKLPSYRLGFEHTNSEGQSITRQLLAVFKEGLTDGYDNGYDSSIYDLQQKDVYWVPNGNDEKYVIAGLDTYNADMEIPLELTMDTDGFVSFITLEKDETVDDVYLYDKLNDIFYGLRTEKSIYVSEGVHSDRYYVTFRKSALGLNEVKDDELIVYFDKMNDELVVKATNSTKSLQLELYTVTGSKLKEEVITEEKRLPVPGIASGVYFVRIKTENGIFSQKILLMKK
ncbi:T9SS type A sorting domain-containing protein [Flavicella sediminum]|uniref:T9SS type A sorting domain-containing protein n=1 Tax=Flavicella sediminum TaxID=2585141 RepID=UPI001123C802|nr:T9SS type A sorting domain-containing protein [Flavicella sediminum]